MFKCVEQKTLDYICYVCGKFTPKSSKRCDLNNKTIKDSYEEKCKRKLVSYSGVTPDFVCKSCYTALTEKRENRCITAMIAIIWNIPNMAHTDCYACLFPPILRKNGVIGILWYILQQHPGRIQ